jgi:hypothetical protein
MPSVRGATIDQGSRNTRPTRRDTRIAVARPLYRIPGTSVYVDSVDRLRREGVRQCRDLVFSVSKSRRASVCHFDHRPSSVT